MVDHINPQAVHGSQIKAKKSFDEYVNIALHVRHNRDDCQWQLGDIANEIQVVYGADSVGQLASEIGMKKSTLLTYRTVSRAFPQEERLDGLSFTHHQLVVPTDNPERWLHQAADGMWSVEKLQYEIGQTKEADPAKVAKREEKIVMAAEWLRGQFEERVGRDGDMPSPQQLKNMVLRIMEIVRRGE